MSIASHPYTKACKPSHNVLRPLVLDAAPHKRNHHMAHVTNFHLIVLLNDRSSPSIGLQQGALGTHSLVQTALWPLLSAVQLIP